MGLQVDLRAALLVRQDSPMASLSDIGWILSPAIGKHLWKHTKKHVRWLGGLPDRRGIFSARDPWMGPCRRALKYPREDRQCRRRVPRALDRTEAGRHRV